MAHFMLTFSGSVFLIKRSKRHLPMRIRLMLYNSLVMSHCNYCSIIWSCESNELNRLVITQKRAIRTICKSPYNSHTEPLFCKTKTLKLKHILELNILKLGNKYYVFEPCFWFAFYFSLYIINLNEMKVFWTCLIHCFCL